MYDKLFRKIIECLSTLSRHIKVVEQIMEIEFKHHYLVKFIEHIDSRERRQQCLHVLSGILIEFTSHMPMVQHLLVALQYERTTVKEIRKINGC